MGEVGLGLVDLAVVHDTPGLQPILHGRQPFLDGEVLELPLKGMGLLGWSLSP